MKFQVREGYVVRFPRSVQIAEDQVQLQEVIAFAGQVLDLDADEAHQHAHKLEPKDAKGEQLLSAKVLPSSAPVGGLTPEALTLVQETAKALAVQIVAGLQPQPAS